MDRLTAEVVRLRQEQAAPSAVLSQNRDSICYLYAEYELDPPQGVGATIRLRSSGTGFVVANGVIATSKHVLEPLYESAAAQSYLEGGDAPRRKKMLAFFPALAAPVPLTEVHYDSKDDLALARLALPPNLQSPHPLRLAARTASAGDAVVVAGYPLGTRGMIAKSPQPVYERLELREEGAKVASELANLSLIRPSATFGHVGDVVGSKLMYDAPTAHGGSGGPVFNLDGEVVGVNAAYVNGFTGGSLGISVEALKPLLQSLP